MKRKVIGIGPLETPDPMGCAARQAAIQANMERCPRFERCNRNKCPLDAELELRYGGTECLWMQDGDGKPRPANTGKGMVTYVTGAQMPDELLAYVPVENVERLNWSSSNRWQEMRVAAKSKTEREGGKRHPPIEELTPGGSTVT